MINKKLLSFDRKALRYVGLNVLFQWLGMLCNVVLVMTVSRLIGGVFAVLCAVIAMNGIRVVRKEPLTERNMLVIGLPVLSALFATLAPPDYVKTLPEFAQYFLGSSVAFGAVCAVILHQILPRSAAERG